jgi:excisionase family DNA binding protein
MKNTSTNLSEMNEKQLLLTNSVGEEFCTTREAAKILGLSMSSVQEMVESNTLGAWKTKGGHRRVSIRSVREQLDKRSGDGEGTNLSASSLLNVLIAEDDLALQKLYKLTLDGWNMPMSLKIVGSGFEGLLNIGQQLPDIVILDLKMPGLDGFEMIRALRATQNMQNMDIIVVTGMGLDQIKSRGGLPDTVTVYEKPIPFAEIRGYFQAKITQLHRRALNINR